MNRKEHIENSATAIRESAPIDRELDVLSSRINELDQVIDRVWMKTTPVRNSMPCCPNDPEREQPSMSPVSSRIHDQSIRLKNLTESIERLLSEIEL